jgi:CBS-domain-containing membrane protein
MTPTSLVISESTALDAAIAILADKRLSAAAVIDTLGQPVGIVNRSELQSVKRQMAGRRRSAGYEAVVAGPVVRDLMTPVFFSIRAEAPADRVIQEIRALRLHRLFVMSEGKGLVGFINGTSLLEHDVHDGATDWRSL